MEYAYDWVPLASFERRFGKGDYSQAKSYRTEGLTNLYVHLFPIL